MGDGEEVMPAKEKQRVFRNSLPSVLLIVKQLSKVSLIFFFFNEASGRCSGTKQTSHFQEAQHELYFFNSIQLYYFFLKKGQSTSTKLGRSPDIFHWKE